MRFCRWKRGRFVEELAANRFWQGLEMSKSRIVVRIVGVIVVCFGLMYLWVVYSMRQAINRAFGPDAERDVLDLSLALKGVAGKSLLEHGNMIPSQSDLGAHDNVIGMGKELLTAYRKDPETYNRNARVFETYSNAFDVGRAAFSTAASARPVTSSAELASLAPDKRLDAWGHPFCLMVANNRIAVISGGSRADAPTSCSNTGVSKREIRSSEYNFYESPSGKLVLIVGKDSTKGSVPSFPKP
jgi:hypothetical protein